MKKVILHSELNSKKKAITQSLGIRVFLAEESTGTKALRQKCCVFEERGKKGQCGVTGLAGKGHEVRSKQHKAKDGI